MNIKIKKCVICSTIIVASLTLGGCSAPEVSANSILKVIDLTAMRSEKKANNNNNNPNKNILNAISGEFANSKKRKKIRQSAKALHKSFELYFYSGELCIS